MSNSSGSAALQGAAESPAAAATRADSLGPQPPHDADGAAPRRKRFKGFDSAVHNPEDDDQCGLGGCVVGGERRPSCDQVAAAVRNTIATMTGDPMEQPGLVGQRHAVGGLEGAEEDKSDLSSAVGGEGNSSKALWMTPLELRARVTQRSSTTPQAVSVRAPALHERAFRTPLQVLVNVHLPLEA